MPQAKITEESIKELKVIGTSETTDFWEKYLDGSVGVRVSYTGHMTFIAMYCIGGRYKRITLGKVKEMSLKEAKDKAKVIFQKHRELRGFKVSTLERYANDISEMYGSEFVVADNNMLVNRFDKSDFEKIEAIVRKYIPNAKLKFEKTNASKTDLDTYIVRLDQNRFG